MVNIISILAVLSMMRCSCLQLVQCTRRQFLNRPSPVWVAFSLWWLSVGKYSLIFICLFAFTPYHHGFCCRPAYLIANLSGPAKYAGKPNSHFNPSSALFDDDYPRAKRRAQIMKSDIGVLIVLACIAYAISVYGLWVVTAMYIVPYLGVNFWLVTITYLQVRHF